MRELTAEDFKKFLAEQGYNWSGLIADNTNHRYEQFKKCSKFLSSLNDKYILLGSNEDWDEESGVISVKDANVKYIKHDLTTFNVYYKDNKGLNYCNLAKALTDEWIKYLVLNVEGYAESMLETCKHIQEKTSKEIAERNGLISKRIKELQQEANELNERSKFKLNKSKQVEKLIKKLKPNLQV